MVLLDFGRIRVGKTVKLPIIIKNDGVIPATAKFRLSPHAQFKFLDQPNFTLSPKSYQQFRVEFTPKDVGVVQWEIKMATMLNPYEQQRIRIKGEGYFESIVFEDLPQDREDEALFGDCVINKRRRVKFFIRNTSD